MIIEHKFDRYLISLCKQTTRSKKPLLLLASTKYLKPPEGGYRHQGKQRSNLCVLESINDDWLAITMQLSIGVMGGVASSHMAIGHRVSQS